MISSVLYRVLRETCTHRTGSPLFEEASTPSVAIKRKGLMSEWVELMKSLMVITVLMASFVT